MHGVENILENAIRIATWPELMLLIALNNIRMEARKVAKRGETATKKA